MKAQILFEETVDRETREKLLKKLTAVSQAVKNMTQLPSKED